MGDRLSKVRYAGEVCNHESECECDLFLPSRPPTPRQKIDDFIARLQLMKVEAGKLGLYETMHAIDTATTKVGYELAEKIKKRKAK